MINIGMMLATVRSKRGLTQAQVAKRARTTQARVSEVETMKGDARIGTIARIARVLHCEIEIVYKPRGKRS